MDEVANAQRERQQPHASSAVTEKRQPTGAKRRRPDVWGRDHNDDSEGAESTRGFEFDSQQAFLDAFLDYFFNSLKFFGQKSTYEHEERPPDHSTATVPTRVWQRSSLDSVYLIRADVFDRQNEIAFSYIVAAQTTCGICGWQSTRYSTRRSGSVKVGVNWSSWYLTSSLKQ